MPGEWITDRQCRRYMERRRSGDTQAVAAARAGISERSGRRLTASAQLPSQSRKRRGRTRLDPLADLWDEIVVPMLHEVPMLRATTVMEEIGRDHPGRLDERHLRTLQRRIAHWRATAGPEREIIFRQEHPPGYQSLCDFTEPAGFEVTIAGVPFDHLLFHFQPPMLSDWTAPHIVVVCEKCGQRESFDTAAIRASTVGDVRLIDLRQSLTASCARVRAGQT